MNLNLIPQPESTAMRQEPPFRLDEHTVVVASGDAVAPGRMLSQWLGAGVGVHPPVLAAAPQTGTAIRLSLEGDLPAADTVAAEAYRLQSGAAELSITAAHPAGLMRGIQTLRQLLPADTLRAAAVVEPPVFVPAVEIVDRPRFAWRGCMLDVARHFMPKEFLLRMIDLACLHKLNVFHLHLTDDQGWRLEVPGWPKLTEISTWRAETVLGHARDESLAYDGTPHGGYYTAADLKEVVAYAAARHITVVPEIDLPGHVRSVLAAYPELGNTDQTKPVASTFGIFSEVLAPTDEALRFARDVFDFVVDIFPSRYIHIGGDECPRTEWKASAAARDKAAELGIEVEALQSWFTGQFAAHLAQYGRTVVGWDEILDGGAPDDAVVAVWREFAIAAKAVAKGHRVIVAPEDVLYLNYYESQGQDEPLHIFRHTPFEQIAEFEPIPQGAAADGVLGVQAQLWSEYFPQPKTVEYSAFPRFAAVADLAWSSPHARSADSVLDRIDAHLRRLDALGVNYRPRSGPRPWQRGGTGVRARFDVEVDDGLGGGVPDLPGH